MKQDRIEYEQVLAAELVCKAERRRAERSPEARAARDAAVTGSYLTGRSYGREKARAAEKTALQDPQYRAARNRYRRIKRAYDRQFRGEGK